MISHSDDYLEYCRETARHARDLHDLALRGRDKKEITRLIHEHIVEAVGLRSGDDLVDIGCGDGTLLRMAREVGVCSALGLLATEEEVALLRRTGLNVRQGLTDRLPVADASGFSRGLQQRSPRRSARKNSGEPVRDLPHRQARRPHFHRRDSLG